MPRYLKITGIAIFSIFTLFFCAFCQEESVTITTYYPSPYGVYKELRLYPNTSPSACGANNKGAMYYNDSDNQTYVCDGSSWQSLQGKNYRMAECGAAKWAGWSTPVSCTATCPAGYTIVSACKAFGRTSTSSPTIDAGSTALWNCVMYSSGDCIGSTSCTKSREGSPDTNYNDAVRVKILCEK